jgi:NADH-quinone oxidoreductase subunit C
MDNQYLEIAASLKESFAFEQKIDHDQLVLIVPPEQIVDLVKALRDTHHFNMLSDETAVDYYPQTAPRFHVIYQLRDLVRNLLITLRVPLNNNAARLQTMETVFPVANWFERELWDMFGIHFEGHSDLRRILMPHDWEGHPLRKDFPLGYEEVQFTFNWEEIQARKPHPKD